MCSYAYENVMFLHKLHLHCFRNITDFSFYPSEQNIIIGDNGHGKTNLLEALVFLTYGKSFRVHNVDSLIQNGANASFVSAKVVKNNQHNVFRFCLEKLGSKQFYINDKKTSSSFIHREFPLIVFSPESLVLLKGSAEHRRWWLDYWLSSQNQGLCVREFKQALMQKNSILKQIRQKFISVKRGSEILDSINEVFIQKSLNLVATRKHMLESLNGFLEESSQFIFQNQSSLLSQQIKNNVKISYCIKGITSEKPENLKKEFTQKIQENNLKEQEAGVSLYGAHRDDFQIFFRGKDNRYFCSQGEQRGLLLSLKIAQILWFYRVQKKTCLLLLDDIFSEIDTHLTINLLCFLNKIPSQKILTSTHVPTFLDKKQFQIFYIKNGFLKKDILHGRKTKVKSKYKSL